MHDAVADVLRLPKGGDHGKDPLLLPELQMGLEAHQIVDAPLRVVPAELHHGVGLLPGGRVLQATGLQRPVAEGVLPPAGHDLHRHTALEDQLVLKAVDRGLLGVTELPPEGPVLLLRQGAVDVVGAALVVPGGEPRPGHIHALVGHQGGGGVKEVEGGALTEAVLQVPGQLVAGQRPGGHDHRPLLRQRGDLLLHNGDVGMGADRPCHIGGEALPIHRQGPAGLHPRGVGGPEDHAVQPPQLLLQKAHGVLQPGPPEGVGADQLREIFTCVGGGHLLRLHLHQGDGQPPPGQLPGRLAARQTGADHSYIHCFSSLLPNDCHSISLWGLPAPTPQGRGVSPPRGE